MKTATDHKAEGAEVVELQIAARAENVALARLALTGVAAAAGAPPAVVADLKLAVSEACTNAVQHAYTDTRANGDRRVTLRFVVSERKLRVEVEDEGSGFGFVTRGSWEESLDDIAEVDDRGLGMGLTIVRSVTDELEIESGDLGTRVVFSKGF
jgi:serine/threonine-protein kinase RsbW